MNVTTRLISLLLAILLCMSLLPMAAMADEAGEAENIITEEAPEGISEETAQDIPIEEPAEEILPAESADDAQPGTAAEIPADSSSEETLPDAVMEAEAAASELPVDEDDVMMPIDGVYGLVISSSSDSRISSMLALIDNQNFTGSGINATQAKSYVEHFLYTSNFKAIGHGVYSYPNSGNYTFSVSDGTYTRAISGSKGCMSYCRFVSKVFYNAEGSLRFSSIQTASSLKSMLQKYGQAGDHIRMGSRHSVTFISCDDNGFYCLSYQGDSTRYIYLEYWTYANFVAYYTGTPIGIYDANTAENSTSSSGSESSETDESTLGISNAVYPTDTIAYGKGFSLGGLISSNYTLTNVTASVCNTSGTAVLSYSANPASKSYNISGSDLDNALKFGTLSQGNYTYILTASDSTGKTLTLVTSPFICGSATTYTVTYNANGGTGAPASQTKSHDVTLTLSSTIPTLEGQEFLGWATSSTTDTADYEAGARYTENKSITLYAVWSGAGLRYEDGKLYYYNKSGEKETGLVTVGDKTYYFDPSDGGAAYQSKWMYVNNEGWYYFGVNGVMAANGVHTIDGSHYYFDTTGIMVSNGWFERSGNTYYADKTGRLACGITEIDNEKYYFNDDCVRTIGWVTLDAGCYYFETANEKDDSGESNYAQMVYGWKEISGETYFFDDNGLMHTGWMKIEEEGQIIDVYTYYFTEDGKMVTGWYKIDGSWYYFNDTVQAAYGLMDFSDWPEGTRYLDPDGKLAVGLQLIGQDYYLFSDDESTPAEGLGKMVSGWICRDNSWYYFGNYMYTGTQRIDGENYTFDSTGKLVTGTYKIDGKLYRIDSNNEISPVGWYKSDSKTYYINSDGTLFTGWMWYEGSFYYFMADGVMAANTTVNYNNTTYGFDSDGKMMTSGLATINGSGYYFQSSGAAIANSWLWDNGAFYYTGSDGKISKNQWLSYGGAWYYFGADGKMTTGMIEIKEGSNNTLYHFSDGGKMSTGWLWNNGYFYYAGSDGRIYKNQWLSYGGSWYYFDTDGKMVTGMTVMKEGANNNLYYFYGSGRMCTGWLWDNGSFYYADSSGRICKNTWLYYSGAWYYFDTNGKMVTSTYNGYTFDSNGVWTGYAS